MRKNIEEFGSRENYQCTDEERLRISKLRAVRHQDLPDVNDHSKYNWKQFLNASEENGVIKYADSKYGRDMYCPNTGIKRTQTMGEFYGNSTVD